MEGLTEFRNIQPEKDIINEVITLPCNLLSKEQIKQTLIENKYSFLHIENPIDEEVEKSDDGTYQKGRYHLERMLRQEIFKETKEECMYIYRFMMNQRIYCGLICCISIEEYKKKNIKPHERIRKEKVRQRKEHIKACGVHTSPVTLIYNKYKAIDTWLFEYTNENKAIYSFNGPDGMKHEVFKVANRCDITYIKRMFEKIDTMYIADGHHRMQATLELSQETNKEMKILSILFGTEELAVQGYNILVEHNTKLSEQEFFFLLKDKFEICKVDSEFYEPNHSHVFGMRYKKEWYELKLREEYKKSLQGIEKVDSYLLYQYILKPVIGITNIEEDPRVDFIEGSKGILILNEKVDKEDKIAFSVFPVEIQDIIQLSNQGEVMPPKSTCFEPKIYNGLFICNI